MKHKKPTNAQIRRERLTQLENQRFAVASSLDDELECIKCGCTTYCACEGGCHWISLNPPICSRCA
jgi:hypothetical protein